MKKISLLFVVVSLMVSAGALAQIPIVYYDFEDNGTRSSLQNAVELSINTPPAGASFTYTTSAAGACNSIDCSNAQGVLGAGQNHLGSATGYALSTGAWDQGGDPGVSAPSRYQFSVNTAGFTGIRLTFDTKYGNNNAPTSIGVLISSNGTSWTFVGSSNTPNGNTLPVKIANNDWSAIEANFNLGANATLSTISNNRANLYIRIYGYNASGGGASAYLSLDNVTIYATGTVAGKVFTTMNENTYVAGYSSGGSTTTLARGGFTATGAGTNVTINGTGGLRMASGQTFGLTSSATVTFGATGALQGTGGIFNIASGCNLITSNTGGIPACVTTTGANVYAAGANYRFNATTATPFPTGTFGATGNVEVNPGAANTVSLNISPTINGALSFIAGNLAIGNNTLTLNGTVTGSSATNLITGGANSNLTVGGSGSLGTLFFNQAIDGTTNNIATFSENRTSGDVSLGNKLVSSTACTLTNGKLSLNGQTLTLNGTFFGGPPNSLSGSTSSVLNIGGTGALGTLFFDQTTPGTTNAVNAFTLNRTGSGQATLGNNLSIGAGSLNLTNGTLADGGNIVTLAGNITGTGNHTGAGKISMTGSGKTISSVALSNLELNNAGGFSLAGSPSIGGTLTFSQGKLSIGTNNLIFGIAAAISGSPSAASMVIANSTGQVRKLLSSNGAFAFPVGDNTNYTPIAINLLNGTYAAGAYCAVNLRNTKHPNNANTTDYLNRYWSVVTAGISALVYKVTSATYVPGDVTGSEANLSTGEFTTAIPWVRHNAANTGSHTLSSDFILDASSDFSGISASNPTVTSSANTSVCEGNSTVLSASGGTGDPVLTYKWAPAAGLSATTGTSVTAAPTATTQYTLTVTDGNGFTGSALTTVTVNSFPAITGNTSLCIGVTNTLSNTTTGGTWESSDIAKATIGSLSGDVTGQSAGTVTITYSPLPGCIVTTEATVLPLPAAITGTTDVCTGSVTSLVHPVSGGNWNSSNALIASVNASGDVTGEAAGTADITYTLPSGCVISTEVTVHPVPATITGTASVCIGATTTLSQSATGGTWSSSAPATASVDAASGVVTGILAGNATITYTVPEGCVTTLEVTVLSLPAAITGSDEVCSGSDITLSNSDGPGTWSSNTPLIASVNSASGVVSGLQAGDAELVYTLANGCTTAKAVTVNALPEAITGTPNVCIGAFRALSTLSSGGTWSSSQIAVASVDATGIVAGLTDGVTEISYTFGNGCSTSVSFTVNALPDPITGDMEVCVNDNVTLASAPGTGTWSTPSGNINIDVNSGVVSGVSDGTAIVTYTLNTGCIAVAEVTVDALPPAITGFDQVCVAENTTLSNFEPVGTWSSATTSIATVNAGTGVVTGIADGEAEISFTLPTGCATSITITINPLPDALTGNTAVCLGSTSTLSSADLGGTWISTTPAVADIDGGGTITTFATGTTTITYTLLTGCYTTAEVTVNPLPAAITGTFNVCVDGNVTLANADAGGTWSSADATVNVGSTSAIVTGVTAGTAIVTYSLPTACIATTEVTVDPLPAAIGGTKEVCEGSMVTLTDTDMPGEWTSASAKVSVDIASGEVSGVSSGIAVVTYTLPTGCIATTDVTVYALPAVITGPSAQCVDETITLNSTPAVGTWDGSNPLIATIGAGGTVTGVAEGTVLVTHTLPTGCLRTTVVTVNPLPDAITGMTPVCVNESIGLSSATSGGDWSGSNDALAVVGTSGTITGVAEGNPFITYTLATGCYRVKEATVNPLPVAIVGDDAVCDGLTKSYTNATIGGAWSSSTIAVATITASGDLTGIMPGTTTVSYTLGTGCKSVLDVTVNALPDMIAGTLDVCRGLNTSLSSVPAGGTWSSNDVAIATIDINSGLLTGVAAGNTVITYRLPTTCIITTEVTVNELPVSITGPAVACEGLSSTLLNSDLGGSWSSGNTAVATVDALGEVSAISAGGAMITYTLPTGCLTAVEYTVNPLPGPFTGAVQVCEGLTGTLSSSITGGTWESSDVAIAPVELGTGVVSGHAAGTADITYVLGTGCQRIETVTVNPAIPNITGIGEVCNGLSLTLANTEAGGTWTSGDISVATVDAASGLVTGAGAGTANITYTVGTGCYATEVVTVNPLPLDITGAMTICAGQSTTLSDASPSGTWSGGTAGIATIGTSGAVSGISAGSASFTYTIPTGCIRTATVLVNPLPVVHAITGGGNYCIGGTGVAIGLDGSDNTDRYDLYNGTALAHTQSGTGGLFSFGSYTASGTYSVVATTVATGCVNNMTGVVPVVILPLVTPSVAISSDHGDTVCNGITNVYTAAPVNGGPTPVYQWLVNSSVVGTGATYSYVPVNGDVVKVNLTSSEACPSPATVSASRAMVVVGNQTPTVNIVKTSSDSVCQFAEAKFRASSTWGGNAPTYTWKRNGITAGTGVNFAYVPNDGDVVSCQLTSNFRCRLADNATSNSITLNVDSVYIPNVTISVQPALVIAPNAVATLTATVTGAGPAPLFVWKLNGTPIPGATSAVLKSSFHDNDMVTCLVYGSGACGLPSFNMVMLTVSATAGWSDQGVAKNDIALVPNPNAGIFRIEGTITGVGNNGALVEVVSMQGQIVYKAIVPSVSGNINEQISLGSDLAAGIYMLSISTENGRKTLPFVIKK